MMSSTNKCRHSLRGFKIYQFLTRPNGTNPRSLWSSKVNSPLFLWRNVFGQDSQTRKYRIDDFRDQKKFSKAVSEAEKIVGYPTSFLNLRCLLSDELSNIAMQMRKLVGTTHPLLKTARDMIFDRKNTLQMRGLAVMLISKAAGPSPSAHYLEQDMISGVYLSQRSLAEITEIIYTANLIHKGIVNLDELLPDDGPPIDMEFGNKMSVLSGDYFLASACSGLAKLGNPLVVEQIASAIGDMMTAEFISYADANGESIKSDSCGGFSHWLKKTYLSTGSLLAKSCQSAMTLVGHSKYFEAMAFAFGENITYVQKLCNDMIPFVKPEESSDIVFTSAPVLLYREAVCEEEFKRFEKLWHGGQTNRKQIVSVVLHSGVLDHCKELSLQYKKKAIASLDCFSESEAKEALVNMVIAVSDVR